MPTDKDVKRRDFWTGAGGVAIGAGAGLLQQLPLDNPAIMDSVTSYVSVPGMVLGGAITAKAIVHNRWYFAAPQRLHRELGEDGWLNEYDLKTTAGAAAMRAQAAHLRPELSARAGRVRRHPVSEYGTCVGRLESGPRRIRGTRVYNQHSRGTLVLGPQGSGKSQWLAHPIIDSPGGLYVSTTKPELAQMAAGIRAQRGPVWIFNPSGYGDVGSTLGWNPVEGCTDQEVADARAAALVRGGGGAKGTERAEFWAQKAVEIIRCYLMAAALVGYDMRAVHWWATNPDSEDVLGILDARPDVVPAAWLGTLRTHLAASPNTRTGYFATVVSCVGFMDNPRVSAACRPTGAQNFDILEFLRAGSLFVIAGQDTRIAPLMTAFTEHIFTMAKRVAAGCKGGRLPNGLAMVLDEVAQTTPVPLDEWSADSRGWGIGVIAAFQDLAQLRTCYGPDRAKTIYSNLRTKIVLPGVAGKQDLEELAFLAGPRKVVDVSEGESIQGGGVFSQESHSTSRRVVKEPVVTGDVIYRLPPWHAYVVGLSPRAAVVKFEPGYKRAARIKKALRKAGQVWAMPVPAAEGGGAAAGAWGAAA
ncbi:type IV secretory system conjugative DNA transfer family protein [Amycolatopsis sp. FU40]|uniref:type IV secretory system conjugative DNA transfer family protein n=1 Tax=Amycolatopsis sp. FU40 TaxID=2914159 RepID=UPI001F29B260|nr:TraM recognition domain-containing protein [Amycolatopsis sp. FU40]